MFNVVDRETVIEIVQDRTISIDSACNEIRVLPSMKNELLDHVIETCCTYSEDDLTPQEKARIGRTLNSIRRNIRALKDKR